MRKIFILLCIVCMVVLIGCDNPIIPVDGTIDQEAVQNVIDEIDFLIFDEEQLDLTKASDRQRIIDVRTAYDELNEEEQALVVNYDSFLEIEEKLRIYNEAEKARQEELIKKQSALDEAAAAMKTLLPDYANNQFDLPIEYEASNELVVFVIWKSSNIQTITTKGNVIRPRGSAVKVTLTASLRCGGESSEISKAVTVLPIQYSRLPLKPVMAYYYSNQMMPTELELKTIDIFIMSFGGIGTGGAVYVNNMNTEQVLPARNSGTRVLFSVQNKEGFKLYTTSNYRSALVKSFVDTVKQYHFDGIDIDWEYPEGVTEINNYVAFIKELYAALKAANPEYLLMSAMYGGNGGKHYNVGEVHPYLDYINLMTYDLNSRELTTHLTPLKASQNYSSVEQTIGHYVGDGVPKSKLVIGGAFYGKDYPVAINTPTVFRVKPLSDPVSILYRNIKKDYLSKLGTPDVTRYWDNTAQAPYLDVIVRDSNNEIIGRKFITYDDVESIKLKCQYITDEGLAGIMFWELGYTDRADNDLIQAVYDVLK